jgi:hypothetical protein
LTFREEFDLKHKWNQDPMKTMMKYISTRDKVIERDKVSLSQGKSHHSSTHTKSLLALAPAREASYITQGESSISSNMREASVSHHKEQTVRKKTKSHRKDRKKKKVYFLFLCK